MNPSYFIFFMAILIGTVTISYWSAKRGNSTYQFYTAAGSLTGFQNGLAIAGDYMSAASFLGITGAIAIHGYDGFFYSVGFLVSYLLLYLIAEPIRHLGKFTLGDVIYARFPSDRMRLVVASNTIIICILYMVPQLVAAGLLVHLLLGSSYTISVLITGVLMTVYVIFGGMVSASWVQIIKTVLLMTGTFLIVLIVLSRFHWNLIDLSHTVARRSPLGTHFFQPGNLFGNPLATLSLNLSLILGTAGLPHILIRFFTVKDVLAVRKTIFTATWVVGLFYLMVLILGMGAVSFVGWRVMTTVDPSGNLTALLLANAVGGDFFMAFISAVAFATILAVVTGLLLSATSSFSHDVFNHILQKGAAAEKRQLRVAKWTAAAIGLVAILLSFGMRHMNVAFIVSLTFVVAASTNLPLLLFTLYWKRFNRTGAVTGMFCGLMSSLVLVLLNAHIIVLGSGWLSHFVTVHLNDPGIFAIPFGFFGAICGTFCSKPHPADEPFHRVLVRAHTGMKLV